MRVETQKHKTFDEKNYAQDTKKNVSRNKCITYFFTNGNYCIS